MKSTNVREFPRARSEYLHWVKTRTPARFNLAASGVMPCSLSELEVRIDEIDINSPGLYGYEPLQNALAVHCNVPVECVVATSGTSMANFIAMAALIQPGDEVWIERPAYEPLLAAAQYLGAVIRRFDRTAEGASGLQPEMFSPKTKLVVLTNLHNPSCARLTGTELRRLLELARLSGARVLIDEVYLECMYEKRDSAFHLGPGVVCTGSLTKAYGLGGLRCGWILAEPELALRIWGLKDLMDPDSSHSGERLSVVALRQLDRLTSRAKAIIDSNRALLLDFLRVCPDVEVVLPEYGTCVFPRIRSGSADDLFELLHRRYDTDIVPGRFFESPQHFRIGTGVDPNVFAEGLARLGKALQEMRG